MRQAKTITAMLIVLVMLISLVGCKDTAGATEPSTATQAATTDNTATTNAPAESTEAMEEITEEKAIAAACIYAGVEASAVKNLVCKLSETDDTVYEVAFDHENKDYHVQVSAITGEVIVTDIPGIGSVDADTDVPGIEESLSTEDAPVDEIQPTIPTEALDG